MLNELNNAYLNAGSASLKEVKGIIWGRRNNKKNFNDSQNKKADSLQEDISDVNEMLDILFPLDI